MPLTSETNNVVMVTEQVTPFPLREIILRERTCLLFAKKLIHSTIQKVIYKTQHVLLWIGFYLLLSRLSHTRSL